MIEEWIDTILQLQRSGRSTKEISRLLHIPVGNLNAYFSKHRDIFPKKRSYHRITEQERLEMQTEYFVDKMSIYAIAKKHGVAHITASKHISLADMSMQHLDEPDLTERGSK